MHDAHAATGSTSASESPWQNYPLIEPGDYSLRYVDHDYMPDRWRGGDFRRLRIWFQLVDGPHVGVVLPMYFTCKKVGNRYAATGTATEIPKTCARLWGKRSQMFNFKRLRTVVVRGRVVTVSKDADGDDLGASEYSKVRKLLRIEPVRAVES